MNPVGTNSMRALLSLNLHTTSFSAKEFGHVVFRRDSGH
jgi:hypothetical protein